MISQVSLAVKKDIVELFHLECQEKECKKYISIKLRKKEKKFILGLDFINKKKTLERQDYHLL
jgi:hypothetical protein